MAHLTGGDLRQEVVGESHYTKALARCFKVGEIDDGGKRSCVVVKLVPENNNKHDKNAVAVVGKFGKVGHLSRADAKLYRKLYGDGEIHTTDAVIVTRDGTLFGIWIDVLLDDDEGRELLIQTQRVRPTKRFGVMFVLYLSLLAMFFGFWVFA